MKRKASAVFCLDLRLSASVCVVDHGDRACCLRGHKLWTFLRGAHQRAPQAGAHKHLSFDNMSTSSDSCRAMSVGNGKHCVLEHRRIPMPGPSPIPIPLKISGYIHIDVYLKM